MGKHIDESLPRDLSTTNRESAGAEERGPPERASFVDFSKKSSISSVLMFALHAFFPFLELFAFFPISLSLCLCVSLCVTSFLPLLLGLGYS